QRGPSFPKATIAFDRKSGQYRAQHQEKQDSEEKTASGPLEMPPDLYNGMATTLMKNLPRGTSATVQMAAFTPEPRLLKMELTPEGEEKVRLGKGRHTGGGYFGKVGVGGVQ